MPVTPPSFDEESYEEALELASKNLVRSVLDAVQQFEINSDPAECSNLLEPSRNQNREKVEMRADSNSMIEAFHSTKAQDSTADGRIETKVDAPPTKAVSIGNDESFCFLPSTLTRSAGVGASSPKSPVAPLEFIPDFPMKKCNVHPTPTSKWEATTNSNRTGASPCSHIREMKDITCVQDLPTVYDRMYNPCRHSLPVYIPSVSFMRAQHRHPICTHFSSPTFVRSSSYRKLDYTVPKLDFLSGAETYRLCKSHDNPIPREIHSCRRHYTKSTVQDRPRFKESAMSWWQPLSGQPASSLPEPPRDIIQKLASEQTKRDKEMAKAIADAEQRAKADRSKYFDVLKAKARKRRRQQLKEKSDLFGTDGVKTERERRRVQTNCFSYATASKERTKDTKTWGPADFFGGDSIRPSVRTWNLDWGDNSSENRPAGAVLQNEIKSNIHTEREIDSEEQRPNYMKDTSVFCRHYRTSPEKSPISRLRKRCESLERQLARVERKRSPRGLRGTDDYPTDSLWAANRALRRRLEQLQEMQLQQDAKFRDARKDLDNLKSKRRLEEQYQMTESNGSISGSSWKDEPSSRDDIQYANRGPRDTWKSHTQTQPTSGQKRWVDRFENMNKRANNMRKVIRQLKTDYAKLSDSVIRMEEKAKLAADCVEALINRANLDKRCPISVTSASKCPLYKMDKCESYHRKAGYGKYR